MTRTQFIVDTHPAIAAEWHPCLNPTPTAHGVAPKSGKKVWWSCSIDACGKEWQAFVFARVKTGVPGCHTCKIKQNPLKYYHAKQLSLGSLASRCPELVCEWDTEKNAPFTPDRVGTGSRKFWWNCSRFGCTTKWQANCANRIKHGTGCPKCKRVELASKVDPSESLEAKFPAIAAEWHPTKNGDLAPKDIHHGNKRSVWWQCSEGHEWRNGTHNRTRLQNGCPNCNSKRRALGLGHAETEKGDKKRPRKELPRTEEEYAEKRAANMQRKSAQSREIGAIGKQWVMELFTGHGMTVSPTRESCAADFLWVTREENGEPVGYGVTVKTSTRRDSFVFLRCNKYPNYIIACVGVEGERKRLWLFNGSEGVMNTAGQIVIGRGRRSSYTEREVSMEGEDVLSKLEGVSASLKEVRLTRASLPNGAKQQREQQTQALVDAVLTTKFVYTMHNERFDMTWHGFRIQAKTATDMGGHWQFKLATYTGSGIRRESPYAYTDFDFLLVYLPGTHDHVLFVSIRELLRYRLVTEQHTPTPAPCVVLQKSGNGKHSWLMEYKRALDAHLDEHMCDIAIASFGDFIHPWCNTNNKPKPQVGIEIRCLLRKNAGSTFHRQSSRCSDP